MISYATGLRALNTAAAHGPGAQQLVRRLAYVLEDAHREARAINDQEWSAVRADADAVGLCVDRLIPR